MAGMHKSSVEQIDEKQAFGELKNVEVNPAAAELAAATEFNKPSLASPGMLKLWFIVSIGYL